MGVGKKRIPGTTGLCFPGDLELFWRGRQLQPWFPVNSWAGWITYRICQMPRGWQKCASPTKVLLFCILGHRVWFPWRFSSYVSQKWWALVSLYTAALLKMTLEELPFELPRSSHLTLLTCILLSFCSSATLCLWLPKRASWHSKVFVAVVQLSLEAKAGLKYCSFKNI